ncbi:MAG: hypothetical protein R2804_10700 [Cyclobacteriaceae bacterium]
MAKILSKSPALRKRIEDARKEVDGQIIFEIEIERVRNVMLKLAQGHAGFELSQPCRKKPDHFWCGALHTLPIDDQETFHSVHFQQNLGEVGSRNMQRLMVTQLTMQSENGEPKNVSMLINDWVDVQDDQYRYISIDEMGMLIIRIVVSEYFACEVAWNI